MKKKLTAKTVEFLSASGTKRLDVLDTLLQGFGIRISPSGRKVWFVMVRSQGRVRRITIGTYPAVLLADARETASKLIRDDQMGLLARPVERLDQSLRETIPLFIEMYAKPKNRRWRQTERVLWKFEKLFDLPLRGIKRTHVVQVLDQLLGAGLKAGANRALAAIKKLMNWALDRGMIDMNPITGLKPPAQEQSRERLLSDRELKLLDAAIDCEPYPFGGMFRLLLLTGQRRGEISGMRWSEIDFDARVWTLPSKRSKNKQSHDVPLTDPALAILKSLPRFVGSDYVFTTTGETSVSGFGRPKARLEAALGCSEWRVHDIRRTVASGMARLGVAPHVIEKVLNHKSGVVSGVAAVYNRYGYANEKREALEKWAAFVEALMPGASETSVTDNSLAA